MEFHESWSTAEQYIYSRLLTATGGTDKVNAFRGYLPPANYDIWMFKMGGSGSAAHTHNAAVTSMWMACEVFGLFKERATAQSFAMKIVQILPVKDVSNVQMFRMTAGGIPTCELKMFPLNNNQNQMVYLWETVIACECVYTTTGTYGDATPHAPKNLAATEGLYSDKVTLTWTASIGATGYEIWRSTTNSYATAALLTSPALVTTYDDETVVAETTYYYWMKAKNASGTSVYCSPVTGHATSS